MNETLSAFEQLKALVSGCAKLANEKGAILYSGWSTLKEGRFYILGLNPGGNDGHSVYHDIINTTEHYSAYQEGEWSTDYVNYSKGCAPHQNRVKRIIESLGIEPNNVLCTNAIFKQSRNKSGVSWQNFEDGWFIHQFLLSIVRPKVIVCLGNGASLSAFSLLHQKSMGSPERSYLPGGHHDSRYAFMKGRGFSGTFDLNGSQLKNVLVLGAPHPSRFDPGEFITNLENAI